MMEKDQKALLNAASSLSCWLISLRRAFHQHPELSNEEGETALCIEAALREMGIPILQGGIGGHGLLAEVQGALPGPTVLLRADMDALPIQEETGLPFSSERPGVMHACGHDHHITILLGAARLLLRFRERLSGNVRLLFQPAEEFSPVGGARRMIEAGVLRGVSAVFGLHVWPGLPAGTIGIREGAVMAASDHFVIRFKGQSAHAAMPHLGNDALLAGCHFVTAAQSIVSRNLDPMRSAVLAIGKMEAGIRYNVVAADCRIEGTARTFGPEVRQMVERRLRALYEGTCAAFSLGEGMFSYERGYDAVRNPREGAAYVKETAKQLFGASSVVEPEMPAMTAEDFAFYLNELPGAFFWLGTDQAGELSWPLHSPHYAGNEDVLWRGAALMAALALFHADAHFPGV